MDVRQVLGGKLIYYFFNCDKKLIYKIIYVPIWYILFFVTNKFFPFLFITYL